MNKMPLFLVTSCNAVVNLAVPSLSSFYPDVSMNPLFERAAAAGAALGAAGGCGRPMPGSGA